MIFRITTFRFDRLGGKPTGETEFGTQQHEFKSENHMRGSVRRYLSDRVGLGIEIFKIEKWTDNDGWVEMPCFDAEEVAAYQRQLYAWVAFNGATTPANRLEATAAREAYRSKYPDWT